MKKIYPLSLTSLSLLCSHLTWSSESWTIESTVEWADGVESSEGVTIQKGVVSPTEKAGSLRTKMKTFQEKRSAKSLPSANPNVPPPLCQ